MLQVQITIIHCFATHAPPHPPRAQTYVITVQSHLAMHTAASHIEGEFKAATPQQIPAKSLLTLPLPLSFSPLLLCSYETADRATFEDSAAKFSISRSRTDCTEVSDETTSGISFKTEPFGPPSSPESTNDSKVTRNPDDCAGCGRQIQVGLHTQDVSLPVYLTLCCRLPTACAFCICQLQIHLCPGFEPVNMRRCTYLHIHMYSFF